MRVTILALVALCACNGGDDELDYTIAARFEDANMSVEGARRNGDPANVRGLAFGELEIVLYDYRPGQSIQLNPNFGSGIDGSGATEWSYMSPLLSGQPDARDVFLADNGTVDIAALAADAVMGPPDLNSWANSEWVQEVGAFDVDFAEVFISGTGMAYELSSGVHYFGDWFGNPSPANDGTINDQLVKSPYANAPQTLLNPVFPVWDLVDFAPTTRSDLQTNSVNVLFARDDWFGEVRYVMLNNTGAGGFYVFDGIRYDSLSDTNPLTTDQVNMLVSLGNEGTTRRSYQLFVIVPMPGPVRVVYNEDATHTTPLDPATAPVELLGSSFQVTFAYDVDGAMDLDWSNPVNVDPPEYGSHAFTVSQVRPGGSYAFTLNDVTYDVSVSGDVTTVEEVAAELYAAIRGGGIPNDLQPSLNWSADGATVTASADQPVLLMTGDAGLSHVETLPAPYLVWAGDSNRVPFGVSLTMDAIHDECPDSEFLATLSCYDGTASDCCVCPSGTEYTGSITDAALRLCDPV